MSCRATTVLLSGVAAACLAGAWLPADAWAQEGTVSGLRGSISTVGEPDTVDPETTGSVATSPLPEAMRDPAALIQGQPAGVANRAPPRASRPVQAPSVHGTVQGRVRAPSPSVASLPPPPPPLAPPPRRRAPVEEDAYAPLGLRLGGLTLRPGVTNSIGYDSNPQRVSGPSKGSFFGRHEADLDIQSDWNVHQLRGRLRGAYSQYYREKEASRPDGEGNLDLKLDASRDTSILLESRFRLDTQRPGSPDLDAPVVGRPLVYTYGGSAGVTHDINRLQLTLRGSVDRYDYEDAKLISGATLSQQDRNQTQYGVRLRAGYELTPGFKPFVQGELDTRHFDQRVDSNGFERSSNGYTARVGSTFEISRQLTGEVSVGYQDRAYEDPRLKNLRGLVGDAAILWTPTALTTVTLRGTSELGDTTIAGSSGTTARRATLEVAHALRRNLIVTGTAHFGRTLYEGQGLREDYWSLGAKVEYKLTRSVAVRASFTHERLNSTAQGSDYTANVAQVGLRLQF